MSDNSNFEPEIRAGIQDGVVAVLELRFTIACPGHGHRDGDHIPHDLGTVRLVATVAGDWEPEVHFEGPGGLFNSELVGPVEMFDLIVSAVHRCIDVFKEELPRYRAIELPGKVPA